MILGVGERTAQSRASFDQHPVAGLVQGFGSAGQQAHPSFVILDFLGNSDDHCGSASGGWDWEGSAGASPGGAAFGAESGAAAVPRLGPSPNAISDKEPTLPSSIRF